MRSGTGGKPYPDKEIAARVVHSTYMDVNDMYSILAAIHHVFDIEGVDHATKLEQMVLTLAHKFPDMRVKPVDVPLEIAYLTAGRRNIPRLEHGQQTITRFMNQLP